LDLTTHKKNLSAAQKGSNIDAIFEVNIMSRVLVSLSVAEMGNEFKVGRKRRWRDGERDDAM